MRRIFYALVLVSSGAVGWYGGTALGHAIVANMDTRIAGATFDDTPGWHDGRTDIDDWNDD